MGRKKQSRQIKCPRCGQIGSLRLKDRKGSSVIVYHYDSAKYKKGNRSDSSSCYLGSISKSADEIMSYAFTKSNNKSISNIDRAWFNGVYNKLKNELPCTSEKAELLSDRDFTKFSTLVDEIRKIRLEQEKNNAIIKRTRCWEIKCPKCDHKIIVHATLDDVKLKQHMRLYIQDLDYL